MAYPLGAIFGPEQARWLAFGGSGQVQNPMKVGVTHAQMGLSDGFESQNSNKSGGNSNLKELRTWL